MRKPPTDPPGASLICLLERTPEAMLLRAVGEVDLATIPMLWSKLTATLEDHVNVVVDLNGIQYIDSAGIQALLDAHRLFMQCGQQLVVAEPSRIFRMVLREIAGLEQAIPVFTSVAAALASFRTPALPLPGLRYGTVQAPMNLSAVSRRMAIAIDKDRNRVLASLRDRSEGVDSSALVTDLTLPSEAVERYLLSCTDYGLATWKRHQNGSGQATITDRGRDYLVQQGL